MHITFWITWISLLSLSVSIWTPSKSKISILAYFCLFDGIYTNLVICWMLSDYFRPQRISLRLIRAYICFAKLLLWLISWETYLFIIGLYTTIESLLKCINQKRHFWFFGTKWRDWIRTELCHPLLLNNGAPISWASLQKQQGLNYLMGTGWQMPALSSQNICHSGLSRTNIPD